MNKLTIPAILVATVMVAGAFAFMPVQQASTVHTTIINPLLEAVDFTTTAFLFVDSIADVGDIAQDVADTFGANDDALDVSASLSSQGRITVTQSANIPGQCDIDVTVTDSDSGLVLINDQRVITGATIGDVGFFDLSAPVDALMDAIDVSVETDGTTGATDCDNVGLDFDFRDREYNE